MPGLHVQTANSISSEELAKQEECLKSWENLQAEVHDIHQLFEDISHMVQVRWFTSKLTLTFHTKEPFLTFIVYGGAAYAQST